MSEKFNPAFLANCVRIETPHTTPEAADELRRLIVNTLETQVRALEADPCDELTWEAAQQAADPLGLTILLDPLDPDPDTAYVKAWFAFGGPNVWAERGPEDAHFTLYAAWGGDCAHLVDSNDYLDEVFQPAIENRVELALSR